MCRLRCVSALVDRLYYTGTGIGRGLFIHGWEVDSIITLFFSDFVGFLAVMRTSEPRESNTGIKDITEVPDVELGNQPRVTDPHERSWQ